MQEPSAANFNDTYPLPPDPVIAMGKQNPQKTQQVLTTKIIFIDRTGPPDYAITSLILLIASVFVIFARNYEPVKNKRVHILLPSVYSGVIFILSSLVRVKCRFA